MEWTESATMALVDEWQKYPCLYDVKSDDYHNRVLKSTAMQTIATILKTTGYRRSITTYLYIVNLGLIKFGPWVICYLLRALSLNTDVNDDAIN